MNIIQRIIAPIGRRVDESNPYVDGRLPDGSRVNVVIPPVALDGPHLSIRKFRNIPLTGEGMVENGPMSAEALRYLSGAVRRFAEDRNEKPARHWRIVNEAPTLLMIAIVILVIVKPF